MGLGGEIDSWLLREAAFAVLAVECRVEYSKTNRFENYVSPSSRGRNKQQHQRGRPTTVCEFQRLCLRVFGQVECSIIFSVDFRVKITKQTQHYYR